MNTSNSTNIQFNMIDRAIAKSNISNRAFRVYNVLVSHCPNCIPSLATISKEINQSVSTVQRAIRELEQAELVIVDHRKPIGFNCWLSNRYILPHWNNLQNQLAEKRAEKVKKAKEKAKRKQRKQSAENVLRDVWKSEDVIACWNLEKFTHTYKATVINAIKSILNNTKEYITLGNECVSIQELQETYNKLSVLDIKYACDMAELNKANIKNVGAWLVRMLFVCKSQRLTELERYAIQYQAYTVT